MLSNKKRGGSYWSCYNIDESLKHYISADARHRTSILFASTYETQGRQIYRDRRESSGCLGQGLRTETRFNWVHGILLE